jgi:DNA-binding CsgD family transcriptional regulator
MVTIIEDNDLVSALYDGPFEQPLWSTFLERLRAQVGATYATITFRPPGQHASSPIALHASSAPDRRMRELYETEMYKQNALTSFPLREGRVYDILELLDPADPMQDPFMQKTLIPAGAQFMRVVRVSEPGGLHVWLNICRSKPDFTAADSALLSRLAAHLRRAIRIHIEIERERSQGTVANQMIQRLNFGWISLDAEGRVIESSPEAARVLQHGLGLRKARSGRLIADSAAVNRQLDDAIRNLTKGGVDRPYAINVNRDPWVEILVTPAKAQSEWTIAPPAIIAYVQGDSRSTANRHEQIVELFGLLPSEARLALALSRGMSIAEAAAALEITVETARNYSKKIYAKMGVRSQSDLVRYILTSVLALA